MITKLHLHHRPISEMDAAYGQRKRRGSDLELVLVVVLSVILTLLGLRLVYSEDQAELSSAKAELAE